MPPSTIPSIFNAISSPDPRCENSEPMLPRNGKALSQPHDAWSVLALGAYLLRCREKAARQVAIAAFAEPVVRIRLPPAESPCKPAHRGARVNWTGPLHNVGSRPAPAPFRWTTRALYLSAELARGALRLLAPVPARRKLGTT